jgi:hypothetical protein
MQVLPYEPEAREVFVHNLNHVIRLIALYASILVCFLRRGILLLHGRPSLLIRLSDRDSQRDVCMILGDGSLNSLGMVNKVANCWSISQDKGCAAGCEMVAACQTYGRCIPPCPIQFAVLSI